MASGKKFDLRHKETLKLFLKEFFELFFPDLVDKINFTTAKFIDKELTALFMDHKKAGADKDRDNETDALIASYAWRYQYPCWGSDLES